MPVQLYPCLWFNNNAKEGYDFYSSVFEHCKLLQDTPMVVMFEIEGQKIMGLNGGPKFSINPSISFFVHCKTEEETDSIYHKLLDGGKAMMALGSYDWSPRYGWVADKFGMTWQVMLDHEQEHNAPIVPCFLFTGAQFGKAKQALDLYTGLFADSQVFHIEWYPDGGAVPSTSVLYSRFSLADSVYAAMDGPGEHAFVFNEGVSIVASCDTQEEIDKYWNKLTEGGGKEVQCGWLSDPFGVSWQIIPGNIGTLLSDPEKAPRVMDAVIKMKKIDMATLQNA
ncbi:MAG TPA: VOC family protein [Phnomibacter sp.]|nr:VOC family protein [Phnomibacter sp.]